MDGRRMDGTLRSTAGDGREPPSAVMVTVAEGCHRVDDDVAATPGRHPLRPWDEVERRPGGWIRCHNADVLDRVTRGMTAAAVCLTVAVAACGGDDESGDAERFCGEIDENKALLTDPQFQTADDIEAVLDLYRDIADLAPLSIEAEWNQLVSAYETASSAEPGDEESVQAALAAVYSSEGAAVAVSRWLVANCAVDIGPVVTIVDHPE
jgi:hypothetical protein